MDLVTRGRVRQCPIQSDRNFEARRGGRYADADDGAPDATHGVGDALRERRDCCTRRGGAWQARGGQGAAAAARCCACWPGGRARRAGARARARTKGVYAAGGATRPGQARRGDARPGGGTDALPPAATAHSVWGGGGKSGASTPTDTVCRGAGTLRKTGTLTLRRSWSSTCTRSSKSPSRSTMGPRTSTLRRVRCVLPACPAPCTCDSRLETVEGGRPAALLIQGSASVYSRKVEYLYSLVFQTLDAVNQKKHVLPHLPAERAVGAR
jgi:hypothetical protein